MLNKAIGFAAISVGLAITSFLQPVLEHMFILVLFSSVSFLIALVCGVRYFMSEEGKAEIKEKGLFW